MSKLDQQEIINLLRDETVKLGYVPSRDQFISVVSKKNIDRIFGNYTLLKIAAGLDVPSKKITNDIFKKDLTNHLENYEPRKEKPRSRPYPTMAVVSDIHWPFSNEKVLDRFKRWVDDNKPQYVVINGDARDFYSHSRFPRSHNEFTPREENESGRKMNYDFWLEIRRLSAKSELIQMLGNHCIRPMKRILEEYPEAEDWVVEGLKKEFSFEGVRTFFDHREEFIIDDVMVTHGYRNKIGDHRDYTLYNAICGHTHNGGVVFRRIRGQTLWELNTGYAGDPESKGLSYQPQKITNWTPGFGALDQDGPRFIPV